MSELKEVRVAKEKLDELQTAKDAARRTYRDLKKAGKKSDALEAGSVLTRAVDDWRNAARTADALYDELSDGDKATFDSESAE